MLKINAKKVFISVLFLGLIFGGASGSVLAQDSASTLYVPLIGVTLVPNPLALPGGAGKVTYNYAVKNFLTEVALTNVQVADDKCGSVKFVAGDDNGDSRLDYSETWRYSCTATLSETTQSTVTATGTANSITAIHKAQATVVVGSSTPPPLVSIINTTRVAYPLFLPAGGRRITFTYKVTNPGVVPLNDVTVRSDSCNSMSGKLGNTNGNNLLDINEVWIYTCTTILKQTTTDTVQVTAFANNLKAVADATLTIKLDSPSPVVEVWKILAGVFIVLSVYFVLTSANKPGRTRSKKR